MNPVSSVIIPVITGSGAPSNAVGVNGQYYYDGTNGMMFGPKAAGAWPAGVKLKNPVGTATGQLFYWDGADIVPISESLLKVDSARNKVTGTSGIYVKNSFFAMGGQGAGDLSLTGLYDRNELCDCAFKGGITVTITGAGTYTNTAANKNLLVNGQSDSIIISGTDATTTKIEILCDLGALCEFYGSQYWQPFVQYRMEGEATYYKKVTVAVSPNNVNWYAPSTGWSTDDVRSNSTVVGLWIGTNGVPYVPGYAWRYARFTFEDRWELAGYASRNQVWISQIGIRHYSAPFARQFPLLAKANDFYLSQNFKDSIAVTNNVTAGKIAAGHTNAVRRLDAIDNADPQSRIGYSSTVYKEEKVDANGDVTVFQSTGDETFYSGLSSTQERTVFSVKRTMPVATDASRTSQVETSYYSFNGAKIGSRVTNDGTNIIHKFGDITAGNYTEIEADGTIKLVGTATVFDDLNFDPDSGGGPAATLPDFVTINNVIHREFTSANNQLCGSVKELPHAYKLSSTLFPHWHGFLKNGESAGTTGVTFTIYWELRQSTGVTSGNVALSATSAELTNNAYKWTVNDNTGFAGSAEIGAQLALTLKRTGGDAGDVIVTTYGVHYEIDTIGSREVTTK